jgi:NADH dehydrogenase
VAEAAGELAGQIAELARGALERNFRLIEPAEARILLLDAAPTILGSFPESLQRRAARHLERIGVEIHLGTMVTGVDAHGIETDAEDPQLRRIDAGTKVWSAGVEASPLGRIVAEAAATAVDCAGRVQVLPDCTLPGYPEVFVNGDQMSLDRLPGFAQVAIQSGRHAAETIMRRHRGDMTRRSFGYRDRGTMATISRFQAIASLGPLRVSGFAGWLLWLVVHLFGLTGFKNRMAVLSNWTIAFLGRGRPQRAITTQQVFASRVSPAQAAAIRSGLGASDVPRRG